MVNLNRIQFYAVNSKEPRCNRYYLHYYGFVCVRYAMTIMISRPGLVSIQFIICPLYSGPFMETYFLLVKIVLVCL